MNIGLAIHLFIVEPYWRVSQFLSRNLGIFSTPFQNKVATSVTVSSQDLSLKA